jgi:outer membrane receptor protein involved in Fe transport
MDKRLQIHTALFYIDCYNQQLTIFPPGQSTGRLMSNAGKTRSFGAELSFVYTCNQWEWSGNYGYTNARFLSYRDGKADYAGKYVPYTPQNTVSLNGEYRWNIKKPWIDDVVFRADWRGAGKIYWNESNTLSQAFYGQLGASISCKKDGYLFSIYGKNITNMVYQTFYFKSVGNSFVQQSKPLQIGLSVKIEI